MKPPPFSYFAPRTVAECSALLGEHGESAKLLAGGQSLVPLMNLRFAFPDVVVDLNRVDGLDYVRVDGDVLAIGAMTRHRTVAGSELVRRHCPLLAEAAALVGYPAIRNRGTLGGSVAHADPIAELPCVVRTLDAELVAEGPRGRRVIAAGDFFHGVLTTALRPDEALVEVRFPLQPAGTSMAFCEFTRKTGDFALAAAAVELSVADGVVQRARIGLAGAGDRPLRAEDAERALVGAAVDTDVAAAAAERVPGSDLVRVMARRAMVSAWEQT